MCAVQQPAAAARIRKNEVRGWAHIVRRRHHKHQRVWYVLLNFAQPKRQQQRQRQQQHTPHNTQNRESGYGISISVKPIWAWCAAREGAAAGAAAVFCVLCVYVWWCVMHAPHARVRVRSMGCPTQSRHGLTLSSSLSSASAAAWITVVPAPRNRQHTHTHILL